MKKYLLASIIIILGLLIALTGKKDQINLKKTSNLKQAAHTTKATNNVSVSKKQKISILFSDTKKFTLEEFEKKFNTFMPTKAILKKMGSFDAHHSHPYLNEATNLLVEATEYFSSNNTAEEKQLEFYLICSEKEIFFNSIRATCLSNASKIYQKLTGQKLSLDLFDYQVASISEELE